MSGIDFILMRHRVNNGTQQKILKKNGKEKQKMKEIEKNNESLGSEEDQFLGWDAITKECNRV